MATDDKVFPFVDIRIVLASIWTAHFLLRIFGDILSLLQATTDPIDDGTLFIAAQLAIAQALLILLCLIANTTLLKSVSVIASFVYLALNVEFLAGAQFVWQFMLGMFCLLFNVLIIKFANKLV